MPPNSLRSTTEVILEECPRFRILVVGKSGVGKSSLVQYAFGIDMKAAVSHIKAGPADINVEIIAPENPRFVLHDSMGFEVGDENTFELIEDFLHERGRQKLSERVHAIWLCIQTPPTADNGPGVVFESGDQRLLQLATEKKVPLVVVFTQYDRLVLSMSEHLDPDLSEEEADAYSVEEARVQFAKLCVEPLQEVNTTLNYGKSGGLSGERFAKPDLPSLDALVELTRNLVETHMAGDAWIVSAMAQRVSAVGKIGGSIAVGMKWYWQGLASGIRLTGHTLEDCLRTIHKEIVDSWSFYDPEDLLLAPAFFDEMKKLVALNEADAKSWFPSIASIQSLLGLVAGATVVATIGPVIGAIALSVWFIKLISDVYRNTPETLRCIMGYIIDLTLVLNKLFLTLHSRKPPVRLTQEDVTSALRDYNTSDLGRVHHDMREYMKEASLKRILAHNSAEEKVKELISKYTSHYTPEGHAASGRSGPRPATGTELDSVV